MYTYTYTYRHVVEELLNRHSDMLKCACKYVDTIETSLDIIELKLFVYMKYM